MKKILRQCMQCGEFKRTEIRSEDYVCGSCIKNIGRILKSKNTKINRYIREYDAIFARYNLLIDRLCIFCRIKSWLFKYDNC